MGAVVWQPGAEPGAGAERDECCVVVLKRRSRTGKTSQLQTADRDGGPERAARRGGRGEESGSRGGLLRAQASSGCGEATIESVSTSYVRNTKKKSEVSGARNRNGRRAPRRSGRAGETVPYWEDAPLADRASGPGDRDGIGEAEDIDEEDD